MYQSADALTFIVVITPSALDERAKLKTFTPLISSGNGSITVAYLSFYNLSASIFFLGSEGIEES